MHAVLWCLQGIYVLQDNNFRWLLRLAPTSASLPDGTSRAEFMAAAAQPYLELPCGLIRGEDCVEFGGSNKAGRHLPAVCVCVLCKKGLWLQVHCGSRHAAGLQLAGCAHAQPAEVCCGS
jgi:hypothetical protein